MGRRRRNIDLQVARDLPGTPLTSLQLLAAYATSVASPAAPKDKAESAEVVFTDHSLVEADRSRSDGADLPVDRLETRRKERIVSAPNLLRTGASRADSVTAKSAEK